MSLFKDELIDIQNKSLHFEQRSDKNNSQLNLCTRFESQICKFVQSMTRQILTAKAQIMENGRSTFNFGEIAQLVVFLIFLAINTIS